MPADLHPAARDALLLAADEIDAQATAFGYVSVTDIARGCEKHGLRRAASLLRARAGAPPAEEPEALEWRRIVTHGNVRLAAQPAQGCSLQVTQDRADGTFGASLFCSIGGLELRGESDDYPTLEAAQGAAERLWKRAKGCVEMLEEPDGP